MSSRSGPVRRTRSGWAASGAAAVLPRHRRQGPDHGDRGLVGSRSRRGPRIEVAGPRSGRGWTGGGRDVGFGRPAGTRSAVRRRDGQVGRDRRARGIDSRGRGHRRGSGERAATGREHRGIDGRRERSGRRRRPATERTGTERRGPERTRTERTRTRTVGARCGAERVGGLGVGVGPGGPARVAAHRLAPRGGVRPGRVGRAVGDGVVGARAGGADRVRVGDGDRGHLDVQRRAVEPRDPAPPPQGTLGQPLDAARGRREPGGALDRPGLGEDREQVGGQLVGGVADRVARDAARSVVQRGGHVGTASGRVGQPAHAAQDRPRPAEPDQAEAAADRAGDRGRPRQVRVPLVPRSHGELGDLGGHVHRELQAHARRRLQPGVGEQPGAEVGGPARHRAEQAGHGLLGEHLPEPDEPGDHRQRPAERQLRHRDQEHDLRGEHDQLPDDHDLGVLDLQRRGVGPVREGVQPVGHLSDGPAARDLLEGALQRLGRGSAVEVGRRGPEGGRRVGGRPDLSGELPQVPGERAELVLVGGRPAVAGQDQEQGAQLRRQVQAHRGPPAGCARRARTVVRPWTVVIRTRRTGAPRSASAMPRRIYRRPEDRTGTPVTPRAATGRDHIHRP